MAPDDALERARSLKGPEKVKRLKELEEKKKEELEETENLLRVAEDEESAEFEKKQKLPIPQIAAVDISFLMSEAERIIFRTRRFAPEARQEAEVQSAAALEEQRLEDMAGEETAKIAALEVQPSQIYGETFEQARESIEQAKKPLYGPTETVTGFSRNEEKASGFYDSIRGFYEMGADNTSEYFRNRTTTGAEEEQAQKKKKS